VTTSSRVPDRAPITPLPDAPAPRRALPERLTGALLLVAAAVGTAFLVFPGIGPAVIPGEEALGRAAPATVRASRDLAIPDEEATRRRREQAAAAEPRVYDHDVAAAAEAEARIREAFQLLRSPEVAGTDRRAPSSGAARAEVRRETVERSRALAARSDEFASRLQARVDPADLAALAEAGFGLPLEEALVRLVRPAVEGLLVGDRGLLAADRDGLHVRDVRAGELRGERQVEDLESVRDVEGARREVEQAAAALPGTSPRLRAALGRVGAALVRPTLVLSQAETERRRQAAADRVTPVVIPVRRGEAVVAAGERIEEKHLVVLRGMREQTRLLDRASMRLGAGVLAGVTLLLLWGAAIRVGGTLRPRKRGAILLAGLFLLTLGLAAAGLAAGDALHDRFRLVSAETFSLGALAPAGAALAAMLLSPAAGVLLAVAGGATAGLLGSPSVVLGLLTLLGSLAAALLLARVQRRRQVWRGGALVGILQALLVAAGWLYGGKGTVGAPTPELGAAMAAAFLGGALLLPVLVLALLRPLESLLGLASDLRLRDIANLNHPALKELIVQAPGTWHHSIVTGALAEAGARAIGADALLARAGAYYHDIGKGRDPSWFSENQRDPNRHADVPPSRSAHVVKKHVEDGVELARRWKLPRPVVDVVAQHHGTRLISFFWAKAPRTPGETPPEADEAFRYPGPKPQTREAALVMIADACEASSRDMADLDRGRALTLAHRRVAEIVDEGQLDECDMTLSDLEAATRAMAEALEWVYRSRGEPTPAGAGSLQLVRP
jgi:putative nucleotidyltransferase with HDIG domain